MSIKFRVNDLWYSPCLKPTKVFIGGVWHALKITDKIYNGVEWVRICPDTPPPPECPDRTLVFQVCNDNAAADDNFEVYVNGTLVGILDLSENAQVGAVFIASLDELPITSGDFVCPTEAMDVFYFNPALIQGGVNIINLVNIQNNGGGNAGTLQIRNYLADGTGFHSPCVVSDLNFNGGSGANFELSFNYTDCCPGDI